MYKEFTEFFMMKFFQKVEPVIIPKPRHGIVCLKCGAYTLQGEKCCDEPIHMKAPETVEY